MEHIGFFEKFREQFECIVTSLPGGTQRVVVFVDDLDRWPTDKALRLLDAIKVFLDGPGCIFVLGLDFNVVQQALSVDEKLSLRKAEFSPEAEKTETSGTAKRLCRGGRIWKTDRPFHCRSFRKTYSRNGTIWGKSSSCRSNCRR